MSHPLTLAETAARLRKSKRWLQDWLAQNPVDAAGRPFYSRLGITLLFREDNIERIEAAMRALARRPTFVYFIGVEDRIKIGRATSWKKRLHSVQTNCPFEAKLLLVLKATVGREGELHRLFKDHRVRGEWHRDHPDIREFIKRRRHLCVTLAGRR